jgi:urea transport system substrate-binding protein
MTLQNAPTILVIEDDEDILATLETFLETEGYQVQAVANGHEALEAIKGRGQLPSLILLDMSMPVLDGWQFAAAFREQYGGATAIVVMSAAADTAQRAREIGASGWLSKPFKLSALLEIVRGCSSA